MKVLVDPVRDILFTDRPCYPLYLAKGDAVDMAADQHTLVAGLAALHRDENGVCTECALNYPCTTAKLVRAATRGAV